MAGRNRRFVLLLLATMFVLGFLFGYFIQGSALVTTESEIEKVRADINDFQLEQLLLSQSPARSCPFIINSASESSISLYNIVNQLRETNPADPAFRKIKADADILSVKSWLLATAVEDKCGQNFTTVLFIYSDDCETCAEQDAILQDRKGANVLVYSVDFNTDERIVNTVKGSYNITSAPAVIVKGNVYGFLEKEQLEAILKKNTSVS